MTRRTKSDGGEVDYRKWARIQFPYLKGMRHSQVCRNRREWMKSVEHLGDKWLLQLKQVRKGTLLRVAS